MSQQSFDVVVVGAGVMGAAAAYHLAKAGQRVLLLEQFQLHHQRGSSHGPSRIIRLAYDSIDYVTLAQSAYQLWHQLAQEAGQVLCVKVGGLDLGVPHAEALAGIRDTYDALGVPYEALSRAEIEYRFPQLRLPDETIGFYQADYSLLAADRCVATLVAQAQYYGALLRDSTTVLTIRPVTDGVEIVTNAGVYQAARLVLCAGSWMRPLLQTLDLDVPLVVTKELLAYYRPATPERYQPGRFPLFIHRFPGTTTLGSGFPLFDHAGVKCMLDRTGPTVDPDDPDRQVIPDRLDLIQQYISQILPDLGTDLIETVTCRYTMTPDEDFIVDRHPAYPQIVIASPCSGHGFKFGVVIGQIVADLAIAGQTNHPIRRFRLDRPALQIG